MDIHTKTTGTTTGAPQAFREMTEKGTAQAKETYEKMTAASTEAADLMQKSYLTAVKGVQDYNNKFFEFAHENSNAAFDFIQKVSGVRSPSAFVELSTEHARKQLELLTEQAKQLATLAQKATLATAEPIKTASQRSNSLKLIADESCGSAHRESHPPCGGEHRDVRGRLINLRLRDSYVRCGGLCGNYRRGQKCSAQHSNSIAVRLRLRPIRSPRGRHHERARMPEASR